MPFPFMSEEVLRGSIPTARTINYDFGTPYSMQYNLNIQREIAPNLVITVGYAGAKHVKLIRPRQVNVPTPEIINGQKFFRAGLARPNRNFSDMVVWNVDATGHYDALLAGLSKNLSRGLQFQVSYTFSKSMDQMSLARANTFGATITQSYDLFDRSRDNARSDFDAQHNFSASYNYELPAGGSLAGVAGQLVQGWNLGGIVKLASGAPFSVGVAGDRNRDTVTSGERPNLRPGADSNPVHPQNADGYFDISSFEAATPGFYGNLGRNTIIGPGLIDFDFSLRKDFSVAETGNVSFRAEFFNIFNRANFQAPRPPGTGLLNIFNASGVPALSAARLTATTTTSRQIQFGLKVSF
ncbi:MAG: hypothetical protein HY315_02495 [Acidobacteria bacterium]|nr:hypothetical protein [Acidobacteriota bacterium]